MEGYTFRVPSDVSERGHCDFPYILLKSIYAAVGEMFEIVDISPAHLMPWSTMPDQYQGKTGTTHQVTPEHHLKLSRPDVFIFAVLVSISAIQESRLLA